MSKNKKSNIFNSIGCLLTLVIVAGVFIFLTGRVADYTYNKNVANEHFTKQDTYKMSEYSEENATAVVNALLKGDKDDIRDLMIDKNADVDKIINYADWTKASEKDIRTLGGGSYRSEPDKDGRMDFGEIYWIKTGKKTYILYVQTVCSRYGKANDGVQAIAATTWEHYDAIDWAWEWQDDNQTVMAGKPFPGYEL